MTRSSITALRQQIAPDCHYRAVSGFLCTVPLHGLPLWPIRTQNAWQQHEKKPGGRIELDSPIGKGTSPALHCTQTVYNRHSSTSYRTPILCSRGFLPWGLSDACLT